MPNEMIQWIADLTCVNLSDSKSRIPGEQAVRKLTEKGAEAVPILIAALKREYVDVIEDIVLITPQIAQILGAIADDNAVESLKEIVLKYSDIETNGTAIYVLEKIGTTKAANALIEIMHEMAVTSQSYTPRSDKLSSAQAASALIAIGRVDEVLKAVDNPSHPAHWQAVLALAEAGDNRAVEPLIKILRESSLAYEPQDHLIVANRMIPAFVKLSGKNAIEVLDEVIQNPRASYHIRRTAEVQKGRLSGQSVTYLDVDVTKLTDAKVLELADSRMETDQNERMNTLLQKQQNEPLTEQEQIELSQIMEIYQQGGLRKAAAMVEAHRRGLNWKPKSTT